MLFIMYIDGGHKLVWGQCYNTTRYRYNGRRYNGVVHIRVIDPSLMT